MYKENFPSRIKKARLDAGYYQEQVAAETGLTQKHISRYETGETEPDIESLGILAQFYNVSVDWLLGISITPKKQ